MTRGEGERGVKGRAMEPDTEHPCPICRTPIRWEGNSYRPFCSRRCQLVDLNGWFTEQYRVPVDRQEDDEDRQYGDPLDH